MLHFHRDPAKTLIKTGGVWKGKINNFFIVSFVTSSLEQFFASDSSWLEFCPCCLPSPASSSLSTLPLLRWCWCYHPTIMFQKIIVPDICHNCRFFCVSYYLFLKKKTKASVLEKILQSKFSPMTQQRVCTISEWFLSRQKFAQN